MADRIDIHTAVYQMQMAQQSIEEGIEQLKRAQAILRVLMNDGPEKRRIFALMNDARLDAVQTRACLNLIRACEAARAVIGSTDGNP